jgi:heme exporter protein B
MFRLLFRQYIRSGFRQREQFLTSILFALVVILLFAFVWTDLARADHVSIILGEVYLTIFFALQLSFMRSFEIEAQDGVFSLMRLYPIGPSLWFLTKFLHVFLYGLMLSVVTLGLALFVHEGTLMIGWESLGGSLLILVMSVGGLAAIGTLLAVMTLQAEARHLLYPVLYFPMTIPVLLAGVEAMRVVVQGNPDWGFLWGSWLGLLAMFFGVYILLGLLLYGELVGVDGRSRSSESYSLKKRAL